MADDDREDRGPRYWWWECSDLADEGLWDMLIREGADNLRLKFDPRTPDGPLLILIDKRTGEPCGSYDLTKTCPPSCL